MADDVNRPKTLLVVEGNAVTREGLAAVLRQQGYEVALAGDGQAALDYLRDSPPPCLILLDLFLPVVDGWEFLQRLNASGQGPPVIVTTYSASVGAEWAAAHGCAGLLRKPFELDALLAEARRCLGLEHRSD